MALYLAFGLPLCCCQISAASACCSPVAPSDAAIPLAADDHAHDEHHHDHGDQQQDELPGNDQPSSPANPCDHDESADCECDGTRSILIETSVAMDFPVFAVAVVNLISPLTIVNRLIVRPLVNSAVGPPTSLVRMHCALII